MIDFVFSFVHGFLVVFVMTFLGLGIASYVLWGKAGWDTFVDIAAASACGTWGVRITHRGHLSTWAAPGSGIGNVACGFRMG